MKTITLIGPDHDVVQAIADLLSNIDYDRLDVQVVLTSTGEVLNDNPDPDYDDAGPRTGR